MVQLKTLLLPALTLIGASSAASNVQEFTPKNFDASVFAGTPSLVEFFAPWYVSKLHPFPHARAKLSRLGAVTART